MTLRNKLTVSDLGCYADGTFGNSHIRQTLANLIEQHSGPATTLFALRNEPFNDFDAEDEAIDWLNDAVCVYPACFAMVDGDLMLINAEGESE